MENDELYLVYVNEVGKNWKGNHIYEFLFSNTTEDIDGDEWDNYPACGKPEPPDSEVITHVGLLTSILKLDVLQDSTNFAMWDAVDDVVALAWENLSEGYDEYPDRRLAFKFGNTIDDVDKRLLERDLRLEYKTKKHGVKK